MWEFVKGIVSPIATLVDELHTSDEERNTLKNELRRIEGTLGMRLIEYEKELVNARSNIIIAEAKGGSWLQRSWRPITMLTFLALVVADSFGLLTTALAPEAWVLLQIGLGGYVVGRSAEKIAPRLLNN